MLESFIISLSSIVFKVLVFISAAWVIWIETSSFVAMLAAAGLAIGMALSGTLQNFAGWVMILLLKPFKNWDFVEVGWYAWTVTQIHIFNTVLLTGDKKRITIPNADISNSSMTNYSTEPKRRLDLLVWIWYWDDIDLTKATLEELANADNRIIVKDWLTIAVDELWDNAVVLKFRFFVKSADYWAVKWDMLENIKKTFDEKWISFPFPQRDVHLYNEK
jgi:small conductance mechanosensitive channel